MHVDAPRTVRHRGRLALEQPPVDVLLPVREIREEHPQLASVQARPTQLRGELPSGGDRANGQLRRVVVAEHDVAMPVVLGAREPDLGPLEARVRDDVRVLRISRHAVALPDRLLGFAPATWREALGVIGQGEEVEARAEAREVAASAGGCAPSPCTSGKLHANASVEKVVCTCRISEQHLGLEGPRAARDAASRSGQASGDRPGRHARRIHGARVPHVRVEQNRGQDQRERQRGARRGERATPSRHDAPRRRLPRGLPAFGTAATAPAGDCPASPAASWTSQSRNAATSARRNASLGPTTKSSSAKVGEHQIRSDGAVVLLAGIPARRRQTRPAGIPLSAPTHHRTEPSG